MASGPGAVSGRHGSADSGHGVPALDDLVELAAVYAEAHAAGDPFAEQRGLDLAEAIAALAAAAAQERREGADVG